MKLAESFVERQIAQADGRYFRGVRLTDMDQRELLAVAVDMHMRLTEESEKRLREFTLKSGMELQQLGGRSYFFPKETQA